MLSFFALQDLPLVDFSYQYDKAVRMGVKETYRYLDVHRGDYALFYQEDGEKVLESNTMSRNYTFGVKATNKVLKKEFSEFGEKVLGKYFKHCWKICTLLNLVVSAPHYPKYDAFCEGKAHQWNLFMNKVDPKPIRNHDTSK